MQQNARISNTESAQQQQNSPTNNEAHTPVTPPEDDPSTTASRNGRPSLLLEKICYHEEITNIAYHYYVLPKCQMPPTKQFLPVEKFVATAIESRLPQLSTTTPQDNLHGRKSYQALAGALRRREDPAMLRMIFVALRTAGNGSTLHQLSGNPTKHNELLHLLLKFNPFDHKKVSTTANKEDMKKSNGNKDELDIYQDYSLADAYFHLILALVSANSVFLVPAMVRFFFVFILD